tara:strand:- start:256 stop:738 length:483 start_codon:yes stop_codon:yes gene_type:complete
VSHSDTVALPESVVTKADLSRLIREVEEYSEVAYQAEVRGSTAPSVHYASPALQFLARQQEGILNSRQARHTLLDQLHTLQGVVIPVHVGFASQPSIKALQQLVVWFRKNVDPSIVVQVGVDPSIIGGCVVRTTNRVFTFTLAEALRSSQTALAKEVAAL